MKRKEIAMRSSLTAALAVVFLAACMTPAEQAAQAEREVDYMVRIYAPACEKLGYMRNTDPWRNCILSMSTRDDIARYNNDLYFSSRWHHFW